MSKRIKENEWGDWKEALRSWEQQNRNLSEELAELRIYLLQDRFLQEQRQRKKEFEASEERLRQEERQRKLEFEASEERLRQEERQRKQEFEASEERLRENTTHTFLRQLCYQGKREVRQQTVPAYTFTKFPGLPCELQLKIWSAVARNREPQTHSLKPDYPVTIVTYVRISVPKVLQICQQSRKEGAKVFTLLPYVKDEDDSDADDSEHRDPSWQPEAYFNTLYDTFYICGRRIHCFPPTVFVGEILKHNPAAPSSTLQLSPSENWWMLKRLENIRLLAVDFRMFLEIPAIVWTDFPNIEVLTLVLYPWTGICDAQTGKEVEIYYSTFQYLAMSHEPCFSKPNWDTTHGDRVQMILQYVTESFEDVKREKPEWAAPKIGVTLRIDAGDDESDYGLGNHPTARLFEDDPTPTTFFLN